MWEMDIFYEKLIQTMLPIYNIISKKIKAEVDLALIYKRKVLSNIICNIMYIIFRM